VTAASAEGACAREIKRLDEAIDAAKAAPPTEVTDRQRAVYLAQLRLTRALLTGRDDDLNATGEFAATAIKQLGPHDDLTVVVARVAMSGHELGQVEDLLAAQPRLRDSSTGRALCADIARQRGELASAASTYSDLMRANPGWEYLSALGGIREEMGDTAGAAELFAAAADDIDAKQMRAYAWVEVQRGRLCQKQGDHSQADEHYKYADRAFSGWWLVAEHRANLLSDTGEFGKAVALRRRLANHTGRPDHQHALADELVRAGRQHEATPYHAAAGEGYQRSVERGERRYLHHYAEFCADVVHDLPLAEQIAKQDYADRPNGHTGLALARILQSQGKDTERRALLDSLLQRGLTGLTGNRHSLVLG
jgi:tetratricopeptide (TPR) repeat protein